MNQVADIAKATEIGHRYLALSSIDVSKTNPRTHFDQGKLDELAESILTHGVINPIIVRPKDDRFELVAGERRLRAAGQVALETIPAIVRELDDKQVLEVQVIENLQRADLHPLEEAEGYDRLIKQHGYDVDALAAKVGKSRSYIYSRLKLSELCEVAKTAMRDGRLSHSIGLLIARIPEPKLQAQAVDDIVGRAGDQYHRAFSVREASEHIQQRYMLRLAEAPFDRDDASLVAEAGPCTTCPLRTGNQSELFSDVKSEDLCTSPGCFGRKVDAHLKIVAKANGWKSLSAAESKKVFDHGTVKYGAGYVDADATAYDLGSYGKKYRDVVPKSTPMVLARDERGRTRQLIAKKDLPKKKGGTTSSSSSSSRGQNKKWDRERELETALEEATLNAITAGLKKKTPSLATAFPIFVQAIAIDRSFNLKEAIEQIGAVPKKRKSKDRATDAIDTVAGLSAQQQIALISVLFFGTDKFGDPKELAPVRNAFFKLIGVDGPGLVAGVTAELKAQWDAADAKKKLGKNAKTKAIKSEPESGVCRECGCTDAMACPDGCTWTDRKQTLCSSCAPDTKAKSKKAAKKAA